MKRLPVMTVLLGVLMIALALPFIFLFGGLLASIIGGGGGIHAGSGGFAFAVSNKRIAIWIIILALAIFAFGIGPKLFRRP
jgi:hypothetical protein